MKTFFNSFHSLFHIPFIYFSFTVAKVIETAATQKTSTTSTASIVISAQQPLTMTSIATSITPSSNSNLTAAVSLAPVKKQRPKTSSPTRHGPQQCQVSFPKTLYSISYWFSCNNEISQKKRMS